MNLLGLLLTCLLGADDPTPTAEQLRFFETAIRPVFAEHCLKCHGSAKQWSNLRLDSRAALLKGGDDGPAVVPGKAAESRLIRAVRQMEDDLKMPPEGEGDKLSERQIADLTRWIEMGAPFPAATEASEKRHRDPNHWAFQPPKSPPLPAVKDASWVQSPIDNFILARLEAEGLRPHGPADKRTLIRRLTFDLIGLPPTPDEIAAFLADDRPDAYSRLVDRLLASPAYGERWARHWLDVARYADSNGLDENVCHGNAWRYRDYVVTAFNRDEPYDRFVLMQLAGDLMPADTEAQRHEQLIATGFLGIGPKVLAEVDEAKMQMDIVDEQIDTVGRALLGLTLGCARCHDHKFDPIATADYYGLAGIFKSTRAMEHYKKVAKWHENVLDSPETRAIQAEYDAKVEAKKTAIADFVVKADEQIRQNPPPGDKLPEKLEPLYSAETKAELKQLRDELALLQKSPPELPSAMGVKDDEVVDVAIHIRGNPLKLGDVAARHVPPVLRGPSPPQFSQSESGRRELAQWMIDPRHPLTSRVIVNRVWRWHFGRGLVPSTDNFGLLGESPTHPELLDWLACRFVADGWSVKSLHRLIVTSAVYQLAPGRLRPGADADNAHAEDAPGRGRPGANWEDPENRLLARFPLRRLEAEAVRDALLAVSGQLDDTMGGSLLNVKNRAYFFDHTSKDLTDYTSSRRSLYLPVVRNNLYDVFQLLDAPDATIPTGDRATTTVAPQALLMLNSDFVMQCAAKFADRLLSEMGDDAARVRGMYVIAYGREATEAEVAESAAFLAELDRALTVKQNNAGERRRQAWGVLCQVVLAGNEFVYVQ